MYSSLVQSILLAKETGNKEKDVHFSESKTEKSFFIIYLLLMLDVDT